MEVEFNGDKLQDIDGDLPRVGDIPSGVSQKTSFLSELEGVRFMVKPSPGALIQVVVDELKPLFGLRKMGTAFVKYKGKPTVLVRWQENLGTLKQVKQAQKAPMFLDPMLRILAFDQVVCPGDRYVGNVLVLRDPGLLAIDEMRAFLFEHDKICKFNKPLARWYFSYGITRRGQETLAEIQRVVKGDAVRAALDWYKIPLSKADTMMERLARLPELIGAEYERRT